MIGRHIKKKEKILLQYLLYYINVLYLLSTLIKTGNVLDLQICLFFFFFNVCDHIFDKKKIEKYLKYNSYEHNL